MHVVKKSVDQGVVLEAIGVDEKAETQTGEDESFVVGK